MWSDLSGNVVHFEEQFLLAGFCKHWSKYPNSWEVNSRRHVPEAYLSSDCWLPANMLETSSAVSTCSKMLINQFWAVNLPCWETAIALFPLRWSNILSGILQCLTQSPKVQQICCTFKLWINACFCTRSFCRANRGGNGIFHCERSTSTDSGWPCHGPSAS